MASTTSFHEQQGAGMPPPGPPSSVAPNLTPNLMMQLAAVNKAPENTAAMMYYYQHLAEKCWGLNSPPGSDASSTASNPRTSSVDIVSGKTYLVNIYLVNLVKKG